MALAEGEEGQGGSRPLKVGSVLAALVVVSGLGRAGCGGRQEGSGGMGCLVRGMAGTGPGERSVMLRFTGGKGRAQRAVGVWGPGLSAGSMMGSGRGWRPSLGPLGVGEEGPGHASGMGAERGRAGSAPGPRRRPSPLSFLPLESGPKPKSPGGWSQDRCPFSCLLLSSVSPLRPRGDLSDLRLGDSPGWG